MHTPKTSADTVTTEHWTNETTIHKVFQLNLFFFSKNKVNINGAIQFFFKYFCKLFINLWVLNCVSVKGYISHSIFSFIMYRSLKRLLMSK